MSLCILIQFFFPLLFDKTRSHYKEQKFMFLGNGALQQKVTKARSDSAVTVFFLHRFIKLSHISDRKKPFSFFWIMKGLIFYKTIMLLFPLWCHANVEIKKRYGSNIFV